MSSDSIFAQLEMHQQRILSKPFNFYTFKFQLEKEDKAMLAKDVILNSLAFKNKSLFNGMFEVIISVHG